MTAGATVPDMDAAAGPQSPPPDRRGAQQWTSGRRRGLLAAGMLVYPALAFNGVAMYSSGARAVVGYLVVAAFVGCVAAASAAVARGRREAPVLLGLMGLLFVAALPSAREFAFFLCAVLVSYAAINRPRAAVPLVAGGVLAAWVVPWAVRPWHEGPGWFEGLAVLFTAATTAAVAGLSRANRDLLEARAEVARLAQEAERNRIARDLHDLLGHSLTVITVKSGLARRLAAGGDADQAVREIGEVEGLSRQALADVRAAVSGYREVTLAGELARGRELLRAAGIEADLPASADPVPPRLQELFGWVLREGLTNVVRHARAGRCRVLLGPDSIEIRDDGARAPAPAAVPAAPAPAPASGDGRGGHGRGGSGLPGLRERVAAAGGTLEAGPDGSRGWRLTVRVPADPAGDAGQTGEAGEVGEAGDAGEAGKGGRDA